MKKQLPIDKIRNRKYTGILYLDCERHQTLIHSLKTNKYKSICILHDKDLYESGEFQGKPKKAHYHFIVSFDNARYLKSVASEFNLEPYEIEPINYYRGALRYLIHLDNPEKAQYFETECQGSLYNDLLKAIDTDSETDKILKIIDYIENSKNQLATSDVIRWACNNNCYDVCRRSASYIRDVIRERNEEIRQLKWAHNSF